MIRIHTLLIGQPQAITDAEGGWTSAIFRTPVDGPVALGPRGLAGDQVADTVHHGTPDQAVCCHPLEHYDYWNIMYALDREGRRLGPGSVGENWTLAGAAERDFCIGDLFRAGSATVQVSAPRIPCWKQERKLNLPEFRGRTLESLRTGFYLRVITPGILQAGDELILEERTNPSLTIQAINECWHRSFDPDFAREANAAPELASSWKAMFLRKLGKLE